MNKIILFVIVLIIGSVLSTGMMEVPEKKDSDSSFQCTIESMKACGNSDKVCLENFMKKCQQHSTEEKTINVSYNHKNHHTYKTSIIVKEHHTTTFDDDDEDDDSKRICITDNNCNCKDLAETSCQNDQSKESCVTNFVKDCNDRCRESRRCYRMDCSNAGHRRCTDDVQIECALEFTDESKRLSCVQEKTACCKRYELATCKRALRVYQYRTDCQTQSQKQCFGINDEKQKCTCIATTRHSCLVDKVQKYRQSVRQVFDCEHSAKTICSEKKCGTEYDECIKRESGRCVPVCTSDNKECAKKWKEENCEKRAAIKCGDDNYCLKAEREICKVQEPKCTNDKSCDDSNKCTEDSCDAVKGCIHKTLNCDDKDECTSDSCDVATGKCTHTPIEKCTKVTVDKCTKQSDCDALNKKLSEECKSAICDTTTQTCKVNVDYKCIDSRVCKKNCVPNSNCEEAVCVYDETLKKHTCKRTQSTDNKCIDKETACKLQCKPANLCETTSCAKQTDGSFTCLRSVNTCNDNKSCTKDSCDVATGKCVNTYVVSEECPQNGNCEKNLDCAQWGLKVELDICLTPVCDTLSGSCKAVPNDNKCSRGTCKKLCPPRNQCEESVCSYDKTTKKVACQYTPKTCDDKNKCTVDTCDNVKGCVNTFDKNVLGCDTPRCEAPKDCVKYAEDNKFADDCKEAICDSETKTCRAVLINNPKCNPYLNKCRRECTPRDACETSTCIVDANTKRYRCERTPITCDDKNACTVDVCDKVKGCKYTYTISDKCEQFCNDNNDCATYGLKKQASLSCQVPYCDKTTSSCRLQEDSNKNCKRVDIKCELACKPQDSCHTARCVRKGDNEFTCVQEPIKCDDGESCTEDSCNAKTGCVFKFKESTTCKKPCKVDIDCDNWAVTEKLADKCQKAFCSRKLGSCVAIKGPQTEKCRTTDQCKVTSDCPQGSKYGSVCCEESGVKQCCEHQCETDLDCVPKDKKKQWGYCKIRDSGKRECEYKDKCKGNEECDDKNPCTKDICITEYGFCKNTRRCVDNTQCTHDICVPGTDGKTYTCKNPTKTCTNDKKLLDKNYDKLTPKDKTRWLGKCSHLEGCVTCVVNAQCDDNNGCTEDSCINQFCVSKPIDNKWCDPKLEGQAITVQGYFPKFTRL